MAIHWQITFKSLRAGTVYTVNIYDVNYSGTPVQLTGAAEPFVTEEDDNEDAFVPIRGQSGHIRFIQESAAIDICPVNATDMPVVLLDGDGNRRWLGFVNGQRQGLPFGAPPYATAIPVYSVLACAAGIPIATNDGWVSIQSLLAQVAAYVPGGIDVISPDVYWGNYLDTIFAIQKNWEENSMVSDALEDFAKYLGLSMIESDGKIWLRNTNYNSYCAIHIPADPMSYSSFSGFGNKTIPMSILTSDNNEQSLSRAYRKVVGDFKTNAYGEGEAMFEMPNMLSTMQVAWVAEYQSILYTQWWGSCGFTSPTGFRQYNNGVQVSNVLNVTWGYHSYNSGGSMVYKTSMDEEVFYLVSSYNLNSSEVRTPGPLLGFDAGQFFLPAGEHATFVMNIQADMYKFMPSSTQGQLVATEELTEGVINVRVKLGNKYLSSTWAPVSGKYAYSWAIVESTAAIAFKDGKIDPDKSGVGGKLELRVELPYSASNAETFDVSIDFMDFATSELTDVCAEIHSVNVSIERDKTFVVGTVPTTDKSNTFIVENNNNYPDTYNIDCNLTTRRGLQYGTGIAYDKNTKTYYANIPDSDNTTTKANFFARPRKTLKLDIDASQLALTPLDTISIASGTYMQLSASRNWRDDNINVTIIDKT